MAESSTCRSLFYEREEEQTNCSKKNEQIREQFFNDIIKQTETFTKAIYRLAKHGELDTQILKIVSSDFNTESDQENVPIAKTKGRKKKPLVEINNDNFQDVQVKKEKISMYNQSEASKSSTNSTSSIVAEIPIENIKKEQVDMPAPIWIPPKKKPKEIRAERSSVRSTRTKGRKASARDSDVVVQNATLTTINLSDTDESDFEKPQKEEMTKRSTRTKTRKGQTQVQTDSGTETDNESTRSTRTKTRNKKEEQSMENTLVEETRSTRTKTLRKEKKVEEDESQKDGQEEIPPTRSTRTKTIKKAAKENDESTNVNVNNNKEEIIAESTRSTRTKTKKITQKEDEEEVSDSQKSNGVPKEKQKIESESSNQGGEKRNRSISDDGEANDKKRSKSTSPVQEIEGNATTQTVYEDAQSTLGQSLEKNKPLLNATYVADVPIPAEIALLNATVTHASKATNCTVAVDKTNFNIFDKKSNNVLLTDDDSVEIEKTPPKKAIPVKASKEVFSPYEKTTLKKKVEAFEKLQNGNEVSVKSSTNSRTTRDAPSAVKEKAKMFTPLGSRFMPSSSSTSKISRLISQQINSSNNESLSAMKSAQKEARERQKRLLEREQAQKKKEAMLQAQAEAKKKLNEEKQLKAQQQRKALEAEKQKQLEVQKQKEAKQKQRELEREEYLQKQKIEQEKKRQAQKKKIQEIHEQRQKIPEDDKSREAKNKIPIYMTSKPPRLPTEDCYDSDDPEYQKITPPSWCVGDYSRRKQIIMLTAGEKIKNTLFCRKPQSPDLVEIFEVIDPKKLKRSSSRYWRAPPRYTMMPDLNETKFEEDDELYDSD